MRKWWVLLIAGSVVVGCSGGSGSFSGTTGTSGTSGTTGTIGTPGRNVPTLNFATDQCDVRTVFLTGQGRRIPGSESARINNIRYNLGILDQIPPTFVGSTDGLVMQLDGYGVHKYSFGYAPPAGSNKVYTSLAFDVWNMYRESPSGSLNLVFSGIFPITDIPVRMPIVSGRQVSLQVYLNNASLFLTGSTPTFDRNEFNFDNGIDVNGYVQGSLSDMISFDISGVADRPTMAGGGFADKFMLTGDAYGIANGFGGVFSFDLFSPNFIESGVLTNEVQLPDGVAPGTYTVLEPDPTVVPPDIVRITALQGYWKSYTAFLSNLNAQNMIIFPTTHEGEPDMAVAFSRSGSTITNLYFGNATINQGAGTGTATMWPVSQVNVPEGSRTGAVTVNLTNFTVVGGKVRDGDFSYSGANGVFVVFRR